MATMLNPNAIPKGSITQEMIDASVLDAKQDVIDDLDTIREGAKIGNEAFDTITSMVNAGYLFAGIATPSADPGVPDAKVFYIANGKGTYTNFGGLEVTEDEVVVLYWDTAWHKEATGIASQAKLTELEGEIITREETPIGLNEVLQNCYPKSDSTGLSFGLTGHTTERYPIVPTKKYRIIIENATQISLVYQNQSASAYTGGYRNTENNEYIFICPSDCYWALVGVKSTSFPNAVAKVYLEEEINKIDALESKLNNDISELNNKTIYESKLIISWNDIANKHLKYIDENGQEYSSAYRWTSDLIRVKQGDTISCANMNLNIGGSNCYGIACYDKDGTFIPNKGIKGNSSSVSGTFEVDESIVFIKISDIKDSNATFSIQSIEPIGEGLSKLSESVDINSNQITSFKKHGISLLEGKRIALFGDSIFEIAGSASGARKKISDYLAEYSNATILNFGFGGSSIVNTHTSSPNYANFDLVNLLPSVISGDLTAQENSASAISTEWVAIVNRLKSFSFADCDIVVLGYGSNDYTNGATIEQMKNQLRISIQAIFEANPKIHILLDLPHWRLWDNPDNYVDDAYNHLNSYGKTLGEYCDAIEEVGKEFGVVSNPNLYNSGWNRYNMNEYFFHADGAHFLSNACKICASRLFEKLNTQGWE